MELFRIAKCQYIRDLSGTGARIYGGRWNSKGNPVLYTAGSRALAALEILVHIPQKNMTKDFCILSLELPKEINVKKIPKKGLPEGWDKIPIQEACQSIGDQWLKKAKYTIFQIPSVVIAEEYNYLINPLHPEASKIEIKQVTPFIFDERISRV